MPISKPGASRVAALIALLAAAGCGSTVATTTGGGALAGSNATGSSNGLSVPGSGSGGTAGIGGAGNSGLAGAGGGLSGDGGAGGGSVGGSGNGGGPGGSGPGGTTGPDNGGGSTPGGSTSGGANGPGVTATTIGLGLGYDPNAAAENAAIGAANASPGDEQKEGNAVVKYVNSHGGVAGRKFNIVWARITASKSASENYQSACATWTQGKDKALIFDLGGTSIMDQCAAQAHAVEVVDGAITLESTAQNAKFPADIDLEGLTNDRAMRYTVEDLKREGYFSSGAKVGIATWADSNFSYGISHQALPLLSSYGIHPTVASITPPQTEGDLGQTSASVSNAVLKFKSLGINHVILFDGASGEASGGILTLEWMDQAQSQQYFPRYGLNTGGGFNALGSELPTKQKVNSIGASWIPSLDEGGQFSPSSTKQKLCLQIMRNAGQPTDNADAVSVELGICDEVFFLQQTLNRVKGAINQQSVLAAINSTGTGYTSLLNFGDDFAPSRHDGPDLIRNMSFQTSCSCFKYTTSPYNPG